MARRNLITNPCVGVSNAGYGGGSTPARVTGLTALGFVRDTGARYTAGTFAQSQSAAVTVGLVYSVSVDIRTATFGWGGGSIYCEFYNGVGSAISGAPNAPISASAGVVTRFQLANSTAPANAVTCRIILDGQNFGTSNTDITAALIEQAATVGSYFDGDTIPGGSWDGTPGLSSSTLADPATRAPRMTSQYGSFF